MQAGSATFWMWNEALAVLERAERVHRQFCQLGEQGHGGPNWVPPVDVFETEEQLVVLVALPGVPAGQSAVELDGTTIVIRGQRRLPPPAHSGRIHRLEVPWGQFERRVDLPARPARLREATQADGCLMLLLDKYGAGP